MSDDDEFEHGAGVTTTEMAVGKYRKRLLQSCGIGIVFGAIAAVILERTYMDILFALYDASIKNWWLIPSIVGITILFLFFSKPRKPKKKGGGKTEKVIISNQQS